MCWLQEYLSAEQLNGAAPAGTVCSADKLSCVLRSLVKCWTPLIFENW